MTWEWNFASGAGNPAFRLLGENLENIAGMEFWLLQKLANSVVLETLQMAWGWNSGVSTTFQIQQNGSLAAEKPRKFCGNGIPSLENLANIRVECPDLEKLFQNLTHMVRREVQLF